MMLITNVTMSNNVFEKLEVLAKGIATEMAPYTESTVRTHTREFQTKKTATKVRPFRRRRFANPAQIKGVKNVQDV